MPRVRKPQAILVQGRAQRTQATSSAPPSSAAMANANATEKPTKPMYSIGGCTIRPKSCSSGFRSLPSASAGTWRRNGLEVSRANSRKPRLTKPSTPMTRARNTSGRRRLNAATATVQTLRISIQSSIEPSCAPQTAEKR